MKYFKLFLLLIIILSLGSCNYSSGRKICNDENKIDYQKSVSYFQKKIEVNPKDQQSYNDLAMSYYKLGQYENAEIIFDELIKINSGYQAAFLNRGLCKLFQNNSFGACRDFEESIILGYDPLVFEGKSVRSYIQENCSKK